MKINFTLNDQPVEMEGEPNQSLLDLLRKKGYHGTKKACDSADCGSCTVLVDGRAMLSCILLAPSIQGCSVTTIEGIGQGQEMDEVQRVFAEENAFQCGFCAPGLILSTHELLDRFDDLSEEEIRHQLRGNLCRCTGYEQQTRAVKKLFEQKKGGEKV